jgi:hypothetical protein
MLISCSLTCKKQTHNVIVKARVARNVFRCRNSEEGRTIGTDSVLSIRADSDWSISVGVSFEEFVDDASSNLADPRSALAHATDGLSHRGKC